MGEEIMILHEDMCVGCPPEIGCLGETCPYKNVPVPYCDECGDIAIYNLDGKDLCEDCFGEFVQEEINCYSNSDIASLLNMNYFKLF